MAIVNVAMGSQTKGASGVCHATSVRRVLGFTFCIDHSLRLCTKRILVGFRTLIDSVDLYQNNERIWTLKESQSTQKVESNTQHIISDKIAPKILTRAIGEAT